MARTLIGNVRGPQGLKGDTGERGPQGLPGEMTASSVAALFSSSTAYGKGDYVTYGGQLYRFTADHAAGDWTGADATAVAIVDEFKSTFVAEYGVTTFNEVDEQVQRGNYVVVAVLSLTGNYYATLNGSTFGERGFGQYTAYEFNVPPELVGEEIYFVEYEISSDEGWATYNKQINAVNAGLVSQFVYTKAYNVGDYVIHNGVVYKFTTAHTAGNYWSNSEVTQAVLADDLSDLKSAITRNAFPLITGFAVRPTNGFITTVNSANWDFVAIPVEPGIDFDITTKIYGPTYYDVLIADITGKVIAQHQTAGSNREIVVNYTGTIVDKSARILYVNTRAGYTPEIVLKTNASAITTAINRTQNTSIIVGCVNCGSYDHHVYGEPVKTDDEYLANWKAMLESCNFDIFNIEDSAFTGVFTQANIYDPVIVSAHHAQQQNQTHTESRIEVLDATDVTLPSTVTVDGVTYSTDRYRGLCCRCVIGGKNVGIYAVHLTPSAGQEPMRKAQFEALIADAARFDEVIFTGDFNCQTIDEYEVFTDAGFTLGNGGYFGTFLTLRDTEPDRAIPADNIIVSDGLTITSFRKITDFVLNTDHRPIIAKIRVKA